MKRCPLTSEPSNLGRPRLGRCRKRLSVPRRDRLRRGHGMQKGCPTGPSCHLSRVCLQAFNPTTDMHSDVRCPDQVAVAGHASPAGLGGSMHACTAGLTLSRLQPLPATQSKAGPWACVHTPRTRAARCCGPGTEKKLTAVPTAVGTAPTHLAQSRDRVLCSWWC